MPTDNVKDSPPKIFISYSHVDEEWKDLIKGHFTVNRNFDIWDDRDIELGSNWYEDIKDSIDSADIALLLISKNFLNSEFIKNEEIPHFLEACQKGEVQVVTVMLSPCDWKNTAWFRPRQGFPKDNKCLDSFLRDNEDNKETSHYINAEIVKLVETLTDKHCKKLDELPKELTLFSQQQESFSDSVQSSIFNYSKDEFIECAREYITNKAYLSKIEVESSVKNMINVLYDSNQKEDLASILHDLSDKSEFHTSLRTWIDEQYNQDNEKIVKEKECIEDDEDHIYIEIISSDEGDYKVIISPRYKNNVISSDDEEDNRNLISFPMDINSLEDRQGFIKIISKLRIEIPIHLIIPEELYFENIRLWLNGRRSLIHYANPLYIHSLERYLDGDRFEDNINKWNIHFNQNEILSDSLVILESSDDMFSGKNKEKKRVIGVCYTYDEIEKEELFESLEFAYVALWSHNTQTEYHTEVIDKFDEIKIGELPHCVNDCQHLSLLWDDMSMLKELKNERNKGV